MRELPIGIQTFEEICRDGYLYVARIYHFNFRAYFEGRKELFEGLAVERMETKWEQYPVLHLDLNAEKYDTK